MTIIASLLRAANTLHSPTARLDVELLLSAILGKSRSYLHTWPEKIVCGEDVETFTNNLQRRRTGEPVAYILGQQFFWKLDLEVTPHTLIPRPETELLVDAALELPLLDPVKLLDLGTGSGAIALALASERQAWHVTAVDRVLEAVALAERNRQRLHLKNATVLNSYWFSALQGHTFDLIVSNPPYIAGNDPHLLSGDVRFEPASALVAGHDGLEDLRVIITKSVVYLNVDGWLLLEHGYNQAVIVRDLLLSEGFEDVHSRMDLGGHERITLGRRPY
ncbi:peptide chain release factor N(5)-glutamine methyltransferase [Candidatus Pseudomonas adelgestsugas]|uniref:Release factor glutamine methyltransferase n=1 Tax=Candidatus Pseudomonas adelgestsugas TaxID=1302376 RepID=A0ABX5R7Y3_9PSED|nr:peptide chain release factor N(5)-glutamine methyltransferase [Candidatus Pseudomonas adelgestsugas]QAX81755.1 Release factor glutamine methyltransferase [Candidatus Pseudomonas adelgestsugas]